MLTMRIFSMAKEVGEAVDIFLGRMCVCSQLLSRFSRVRLCATP